MDEDLFDANEDADADADEGTEHGEVRASPLSATTRSKMLLLSLN